ncbi:RNA methyltransferase [Pseudomonadota bacterium]
MRGYFGVGVEGISKSMNAGAIFRTAHAFGASFVYTVGAVYARQQGSWADTSNSLAHTPFYSFPNESEMLLPQGCRLVGVELTDDAVDLPSFRHPSQCAYILGPERGSLSPAMVEKCDFIIKIPTSFCINVSVAAAIVLYDRSLSMGRFAERPVRPGGPKDAAPQDHSYGGPVLRNLEKYRDTPPLGDGFDPEEYNQDRK